MITFDPEKDDISRLAVDFVQNGGLEQVPVPKLAMSVIASFIPLPDFDVKQEVSFKINPSCAYGAYIEPKEQIGCVLVDAGGIIPVIIFSDFQTESEIIVERNPDGHGDRTIIHSCKDNFWSRMKNHFKID